jgi:hypothetical protein
VVVPVAGALGEVDDMAQLEELSAISGPLSGAGLGKPSPTPTTMPIMYEHLF